MDIKIWMMAFHSITGCDTTTLPSGDCRMSSVAKKKAKSSLFSGKERKLGKLEGRGTLRFSITLLIGCETHEGADTRMILHMLHCKNVSNCRTIAVSATDTMSFCFYCITSLLYFQVKKENLAN
jgi:hypothetical protein